MFDDLGESLYSTWSHEQRREEIDKLITGYRNGVPVGILCRLAVAIAGSEDLAKEHLAALMPLAERQAAVEKETGGLQVQVRSFLL